MNTYWACLDCDEHGEGDKAAERHTKATCHGTMTSTRPDLRQLMPKADEEETP
jgi:hypothetical protein